ncbi:MAG: type II toxin-antitoxin system Phd/YefM family antitoxin [Thiolinea sp.]
MELSIREVRQKLPQLQEILDEYNEIIITRHGQPLARLLPVGKTRPRPSHNDLRAMQPELLTSSAELIREDRDER